MPGKSGNSSKKSVAKPNKKTSTSSTVSKPRTNSGLKYEIAEEYNVGLGSDASARQRDRVGGAMNADASAGQRGRMSGEMEQRSSNNRSSQ